MAKLGSREVFGADQGRELAYMRLPVARVRLACSPREDDFVKGEGTTTSDCCYHEVPHACAARLIFVSLHDLHIPYLS